MEESAEMLLKGKSTCGRMLFNVCASVVSPSLCWCDLIITYITMMEREREKSEKSLLQKYRMNIDSICDRCRKQYMVLPLVANQQRPSSLTVGQIFAATAITLFTSPSHQRTPLRLMWPQFSCQLPVDEKTFKQQQLYKVQIVSFCILHGSWL